MSHGSLFAIFGDRHSTKEDEEEGDVAAKCIKMTRERERMRKRERGEILLSGLRSNVAGEVSSGTECYILRANERGRSGAEM